MKFMVQVRATADMEAGVTPQTELLEAMGRFNTEMAEAGILRAGEGLHPTSRDAARIAFGAGEPTVAPGPFPTEELVAGFWLIEVGSLDEAVGWMRRAPMLAGDVLELRRVFAAEDFGEAFTPELRAEEDRLRERIG